MAAPPTTPPVQAPDTGPVDLTPMREAVNRLLLADAEPPAEAELPALLQQLRGHIELLAPAVEQLARRHRKGDVPRACAFACSGEARMRLRLKPEPAPGGDLTLARKLARSMNALCDHYENLCPEQPSSGE